MPPNLRGGRGRGNRGRVARLDDIGQSQRNLFDHPERKYKVSSSRGEHIGNIASGVYSAAPAHPPLVLPNPQPAQLVPPF